MKRTTLLFASTVFVFLIAISNIALANDPYESITDNETGYVSSYSLTDLTDAGFDVADIESKPFEFEEILETLTPTRLSKEDYVKINFKRFSTTLIEDESVWTLTLRYEVEVGEDINGTTGVRFVFMTNHTEGDALLNVTADFDANEYYKNGVLQGKLLYETVEAPFGSVVFISMNISADSMLSTFNFHYSNVVFAYKVTADALIINLATPSSDIGLFVLLIFGGLIVIVIIIAVASRGNGKRRQ